MSFFEIIGDKIMDLMNEKTAVKLLEDKNGQVQLQGLTEIPMKGPEELMKAMDQGFGLRTTQSTVNNDESSRSHAICQLILRDDQGNRLGKLVLVDLAVVSIVTLGQRESGRYTKER